MTPQERADNNISLDRLWNTDEQIRKQIATEIEAAVREDQLERRDMRDIDYKTGYEEGVKYNCDRCSALSERFGKRQAYEDAAAIADEHNGCVNKECLSKSNCGATAAAQIRSRAEETK